MDDILDISKKKTSQLWPLEALAPLAPLGRSDFLSRMVGASRSERDPELIMPPDGEMGWEISATNMGKMIFIVEDKMS